MRSLALACLVACGAPPEAPASEQAPLGVGGALDPAIPDGNELSISSDAGVREPLRRAVETALVKAMTTARPCMEGIYGTVFADVELDTAGKVTRAHIQSPLLEDSPIAKCMEKELATMQIGKTAAAVKVHYPIRNMPSAQQMKEATELIKGAIK